MTKLKTLTDAKVATAGAGKFTDVKFQGLRVCKSSVYAGSYYYRFRDPVTGEQHEFSLGSIQYMTIAEARMKAKEIRRDVDRGIVVVSRTQQKRARRLEKTQHLTLKEGCIFWLNCMQKDGTWQSNSRSSHTVQRYFEMHVYDLLGNKLMHSITADQVADCLKRIWITNNSTAVKIRQYLEQVFAWCMQKHRCPERSNPADRKTISNLLKHLKNQIPRGEHYAACDVHEIPRLIKELYELNTDTAFACIFAIFTAARSQAVRFSKWSDIDFHRHLWRIPRENDKRKENSRNRTILLSDVAITLLRYMRTKNSSQSEYIFVNNKGKTFTDAALTKTLKNLHKKRFLDDGVGWIDPIKAENNCKNIVITLHGTARSSFAVWTEDVDLGGKLNFDKKAVNLNLLHDVDDGYHGAYFRSPMTQERLRIMQLWGDYCVSMIVK